MAEKLEPGPFCGRDYAAPEVRDGDYFIYCGGCRAEGPNVNRGPAGGQKEARAEAIRLWNTRKQKEPTK